MRKRAVFSFVFLLVICAAGARNAQSDRSAMQVRHDVKTQLPPAYVPPGSQMYKEYCAACHGSDGKGRGPVAASLRKTPAQPHNTCPEARRNLSRRICHQCPAIRTRLFGSRFLRDAGVGASLPVSRELQ